MFFWPLFVAEIRLSPVRAVIRAPGKHPAPPPAGPGCSYLFRKAISRRVPGKAHSPVARGCVGFSYLLRIAISWRLGPVDTMVMGTPTRRSKNST